MVTHETDIARYARASSSCATAVIVRDEPVAGPPRAPETTWPRERERRLEEADMMKPKR